MALKPRVFCAGNGVSKFRAPLKKPKPGVEASSYSVLDDAAAAARTALEEAGVDYPAVDAAVCGYVYADSTAGQAALYRLGLSGLPVYNVNNNCATGSSALSLARMLVASGQHDCVLALGFEQLGSEGLTEQTPEHDVFGRHFGAMESAGVPRAPAMGMSIAAAYSAAAGAHAAKFGTTKQQFAKVAHKNRVHGQQNPEAVMHGAPVPSIEEIVAAPSLGKKSPLTFAMLAPLACGASAAVLVSERHLRASSKSRTIPAVEIVGQALRTDTEASFNVSDKAVAVANICGFDISRRAADAAYAEAGLTSEDVDVAEVHDAFSSNELAMYEALHLCGVGGGGPFVDSGEWRQNSSGARHYHYPRSNGGSVVVNSSGGLESKGHPIGATGLAQCAELCWQLRGAAGARQCTPAPAVGLQHNYGWASAAVVTLYRRVELESAQAKL